MTNYQCLPDDSVGIPTHSVGEPKPINNDERTMKKNEKNKTEDIAIKVEEISKSFRIPHERQMSLKSATLNIFSKKNYETFKALESISFEVKKGEFFGIIGRNGSGKSTLLKILAGIYVADSGKSEMKGKVSPFLELGVGFNPELTGRENLFLGGGILGLSRKEVNEKFDTIVKFAELEEFIDMRLKNYSSGMQVRLAFSLAINAHAEILLMDEVLAVGDTNFQSKCLTEFNKYKEMGKTVILVSHDVATVQRHCDRAMLLRDGRIVRIGNSDEVVAEYINQNIVDEENRIASQESTKSEKDRKSSVNKFAVIKKVEFLSKDGIVKNAFKSSEDFRVRVYFSKNKKVDRLTFGVALLSEDGIPMFGISTLFDQIDTRDMTKQNYFEVLYKKPPLRANTYSVSAAISDASGNTLIDYLQKSNSKFKIFSEDKNAGLVNIDYRWE